MAQIPNLSGLFSMARAPLSRLENCFHVTSSLAMASTFLDASASPQRSQKIISSLIHTWAQWEQNYALRFTQNTSDLWFQTSARDRTMPIIDTDPNKCNKTRLQRTNKLYKLNVSFQQFNRSKESIFPTSKITSVIGLWKWNYSWTASSCCHHQSTSAASLEWNRV